MKQRRQQQSNMAQAHGVKAMAIQADVSQLDEAERLIQQTVEHFGRIDFLICNAGIWEGGPVESISEELWDKTMDINLKGTWSVCRAAVPLMKKQRFRPDRDREFDRRAARRS